MESGKPARELGGKRQQYRHSRTGNQLAGPTLLPARSAAEPPLSTAVLLAMKRLGDRNDWWDWGVILLVVAGGTILLWASVWLAHSSMVTWRSAAALPVIAPLAT
jgi:hypothetical protein